MNIPQEFEDVFRGVELTEDEIRTLTWITGWERRTVENLRSAIRKAQATAPSTLQVENEKLRNEVERQRRSADDRKHLYENAERAYMKVVAELEQVKRENSHLKEILYGMEKD